MAKINRTIRDSAKVGKISRRTANQAAQAVRESRISMRNGRDAKAVGKSTAKK